MSMDFSNALKALKAGHRVQRTGWNGKDMFVMLHRPDAASEMTLPYLYLVYPDGRRVPWLASQTDLLENDWELV